MNQTSALNDLPATQRPPLRMDGVGGGGVGRPDPARFRDRPAAVAPDAAVVPAASAKTLATAEVQGAAPTDDDGFSFWDLLDVVNPLQHLPLVSTVYREITGDKIKPLANLVGGALFGGPIGFIAAAVETIIKDETGRTPGEHALAYVGLKHDAPETEVLVTELPPSAEVGQVASAAPASISVAIPALLLEEARRDAQRTAAKTTAAGGILAQTASASTNSPSIQRDATKAPTAIGAPGQLAPTTAGEAVLPAAPTEFYRTLQRGAPSEPANVQKVNFSTGRVTPPNLVAAQNSMANGAAGAQAAQQAQYAAQLASNAGLQVGMPNVPQASQRAQAPAAAPNALGMTPAVQAAMDQLAPAAAAPAAARAAAPAPAVASAPLPNPTAAASGALPKELVADMMMAALNKYQSGKKADPSSGVLDITQ